MRFDSLAKSSVAILTLAVLATTTLAPVAEAGHRHGDGGGNGGRRYKGAQYESHGNRGYGARVVEVHHSSSAGPVIAGIIGGVALGAILANSSHANSAPPSRDCDNGDNRQSDYDRGNDGPSAYQRGYEHGYRDAQADYEYYDPYCEASFSSFDACRAHERDCHHPRVIQVISNDTGRCVGAYNYRGGNWRSSEVAWNN